MERKNILTIIFLAVIFAFGIFWLFKKVPENEIKSTVKEDIGIGIIADNQETIKKYQAMADYLNKYSDHRWHLAPLQDYGSFIAQFRLGKIKAGFAGSAVAMKLIKENFSYPVVRGEKDGISDYYGYVFTRKDGGINDIDGLKGKKFAYVDPYTSAGYFFPAYLLRNKGYESDNFFRVSSFLGSHKKAILSVLNGEFDAGAAKDSVWKKMAKENPDVEKDLRILASEGPFPEQTFIISVAFGLDEVKELQYLFLKMNQSEGGRNSLTRMGLDRFIVTAKSDFEKVEKITNF